MNLVGAHASPRPVRLDFAAPPRTIADVAAVAVVGWHLIGGEIAAKAA